MRKSTIFLSIAFVISFLGCIYFAVLWIDTSITLTYSDSSYQQNRALQQIHFLLEKEWVGISEQVLFEKIKIAFKKHPEVIVFKKEGVIHVGVLSFELQMGKLESISIHNVPDLPCCKKLNDNP